MIYASAVSGCCWCQARAADVRGSSRVGYWRALLLPLVSSEEMAIAADLPALNQFCQCWLQRRQRLATRRIRNLDT